MLIIGQLSDKQQLEAHFEISFNEKQECFTKFYVDDESEVNVITCQQKHNFNVMHYGMSPFWSGQKILHFEAPVEGEVNEETESDKLKKRIILHPSYRKPIRENRCLIPSDYFIMPSKYGDIFLMYFTESKPFAIAGIYDSWKGSFRDESEYRGFAILTVPANALLQSVGISRMPLILHSKDYYSWLDREAPLTEVTALMDIAPDKYLNGYPIHRNTYNKKTNSSELCRSTGQLLRPESQDTGMIASVLRSFRNKTNHSLLNSPSEERIWRS
jgi:putative SOS response-associated peptidase YedK